MSETAYLKPADGLQVRKPNGSHLATEGEAITFDSYWLRRLNKGDVVATKAPRGSKKES